MKKLMTLCLAALLGGGALFAQLTPNQRERDFVTLANVLAKRYAPANWKIVALNANLFHISPWVARVRAAQNDLEFLDICAQYVSSLQDGHAQFIGPGNFLADLGFYVDLYDGKLLVALIDRNLLSTQDFPVERGDELLTFNGRPALAAAEELAKLHTYANPRYSLRLGAANLTFRSQQDVPTAGLQGETATVTIRRQSGAVESYMLPWFTQGTPITKFGALPEFFGVESKQQRRYWDEEPEPVGSTEIPMWQKLHENFKRWGMHEANNPLRARRASFERKQDLGPEFYLGYGSNRPLWRLPQGFAIRQGRNPSDYFFTGTYMAEGKRIGYMRIGAFDNLSQGQTQILNNEINYFSENTDGLVVDVMQNPGGSCSMVTIAQRLMRGDRFTHFSEQIRPSFDQIASYDEIIDLLSTFGAPDYLLELYRFERQLLIGAYQDGRGLTGAIPACAFDLEVPTAPNAYQKPMIVLIDDFSTSAADIFPAMFQDNGRAKLVGMRTSGAGGRVELVAAGPLSEARTTNTASLVVRAREYDVPGFPRSPYIENVGVRPDIELDFATTENLLQNGTPFVDAFTRIILAEIGGGGY
ncbi:MAG: S41 family peptidase [Bryobacter sp.]|nr:S41 family peptidase [Bryobacter sp.]